MRCRHCKLSPVIKEPEGVIYVERLKSLNRDARCCLTSGVQAFANCQVGGPQSSVVVGQLKGDAGGRNVMILKHGTTS